MTEIYYVDFSKIISVSPFKTNIKESLYLVHKEENI